MDEPGNRGGGVRLREVEGSDLAVFFENQRDPVATQMAAAASREREPFMAHWAKVMADDELFARTIVADGEVAGNIVSWADDSGRRMVGYWIGQQYWQRGIASAALGQALELVEARPLHAYVAVHNAASMRVLHKRGFRRVPGGDSLPPSVDDGVDEAFFVLDG